MNPTYIGRYAIYGALASGGMASVHFGKFTGPGGFARTVAVKRMHPHLAKDSDFAAMFVDEARLAARIQHPNVVATLDVLAASDELLIVMEYVHGESLAELVRSAAARKARTPPSITCAVMVDVLAGLHAAHEATDEQGRSLGVVHRDVSPANVLVGADGIARVADFGVARAAGRLQVTREGQVKGKIAYMAPEQVRGGAVGRAADIYSASVVLWETLTGRRLFEGERDAQLIERILYGSIEAPIAVAPSVPEALNAVVLRGLARDPADRFPTARDMMQALVLAGRPASSSEVSDWVESVAGDKLAERATTLAEIDNRSERIATTTASLAVGSHEVDGTATAQLPARTDAPSRRALRRALLSALALVLLGGLAASVAHFAAAPAARAGQASPPSVGNSEDEAGSTIVEPDQATAIPPVGGSPQSIGSAGPAPPVPRPRRAPPAAGPARLPGRDGCDPPYTTDPDGTRHYKLRCL